MLDDRADQLFPASCVSRMARVQLVLFERAGQALEPSSAPIDRQEDWRDHGPGRHAGRPRSERFISRWATLAKGTESKITIVGALAIALVAAAACNDANTGSTPAFDLSGMWSATLVSDVDGQTYTFTSEIESRDDVGSLSGDTSLFAFCQGPKDVWFAGTLRDVELTVSLRSDETIARIAALLHVRSVLDFVDADNGTGTYAVLEAQGNCDTRLGDTGSIRMQRATP